MLARKIEATIKEVVGEDLVLISSTAGSSDDAGFAALFSSTDNTTIQVTVKTTKKYERKTGRTILEIRNAIRKKLKEYPKLYNFQVSTSMLHGRELSKLEITDTTLTKHLIPVIDLNVTLKTT